MTKRMEHGEYYHADSIHFPDSLKYFTLNSGRTVYGGGGIMPDIFMPADTSFSSKLYLNLIRKVFLTPSLSISPSLTESLFSKNIPNSPTLIRNSL